MSVQSRIPKQQRAAANAVAREVTADPALSAAERYVKIRQALGQPVTITHYPHVWIPPEGETFEQASKRRAKEKVENAQAERARLDARMRRIAERERKAAKEERKRIRAAIKRSEARRVKELEKSPKKATVAPFNGPLMSLDDLDLIDVAAPSDILLDAAQLADLWAEADLDAPKFSEDLTELDRAIEEELNAPPRPWKRLGLNFDRGREKSLQRRKRRQQVYYDFLAYGFPKPKKP